MTKTRNKKKWTKALPPRSESGKGSGKREHAFEAYARWLTMSIEELQDEYNGGEQDPARQKVVKGSDREFAKLYRLRPATLTEWKYKPDLWRRRDKYMLSFRRHTAAVIRGLTRNCMKNGQGTDVKAYMEIVEGRRMDAFGNGAAVMGGIIGAAAEAGAEGTATVNGDGSVDLTLTLRKYEDIQEPVGGDAV